ncbi:MAG: hypothetical protein DRZ80_06295 [Thermoprotei archaeon]|nr:MAG: hypothetical protein DRZ80_06295 [Thermoprotei archaeon]
MPKYRLEIRDSNKNHAKRILKNIVRIFARATLCIGCGLCELVCPTKAIKLVRQNKKYVIMIDEKKCTGCLICNNLCPIGVFYESSIRPLRPT